jgi:tetratricopeptide (TPR) repeat protein
VETVIGIVGVGLIAVYLGSAATRGPRARKLWDRGAAAYEQGRTEEALDAFRKLARMAPSWSPARRMYGVTLMQAGEPVRAEEELRLAAELEPRNAQGWLDLGTFLATRGSERHDEALDALERAVELAPRMREELDRIRLLESLHDDPRFRALLETE